MFHTTFVQIGEFDWLSAKRVNFRKKCLKIFFSETISGMKLKLGIHAQDISLFKSCVFYSGRIRTLVAMATYNSHRLIMGKRKLIIFSVSLGIFGILFTEMFIE